VADLLDNIHSDLRARLQELRPLAAEYERLEAALAALVSTPGNGAAGRSTPSRDRSSSKPRAKRQPARRRAPRGQNQARIVEVISAKPEATVSDIQDATGIDKPIIYNIIRKGIEDGVLDRVVLAGGIQGFKVKSAETTIEPPKPARRRSRRKRSASDAKATTAAPENPPAAGSEPANPDEPAA
jgi:hypothetical protein